MGIDALDNGQRIYPANNPYEIQEKKYNDELLQNQEDKVNQRRTDMLDISSEAKKLSPIISRVNEGFYDKPEVIKEVAARIALDMPPGSVKE